MLRLRSVAWLVGVCAAFVAALVVVADATASERRHAARLSSFESSLLDDMNAMRAARGLSTLRVSAALMSAARAHSEEMETDGYFAHASADGTSFLQRLRSFYRPLRPGWAVGENLLWASPSITVTRTLAVWLGSPEHRANLFDSRWRQVGTSAVHRTSAPGVYDGRTVTIVTMDFGVGD